MKTHRATSTAFAFTWTACQATSTEIPKRRSVIGKFETLRHTGYEVLEIPATALDDRDRMIGYFYRLARLLLGRERADQMRGDTSWFGQGPPPERPRPV